MRWDRLFEDLEAQLVADETRELVAEVADRTRRERAALGLHERFAAVVDRSVVDLRVAGVGVLHGLVVGAGPDWLLLDHRSEPLSVVPSAGAGSATDRPVLVAVAAVRSVIGLRGAQQPGAVAAGFGLGAALRAVSRDRAAVEIVDVDGSQITGTIDGVGRDHLEVAEHSADLPRRRENVLAVRAVPFHALAIVRRH